VWAAGLGAVLARPLHTEPSSGIVPTRKMSGSAGSLPDKHFWLISVPKRDKGEDVFTELNRKTVEMSNLSVDNHKFDIPELRVGAWDVLMTLPDELNKVDMYVEGVVKKIARQTLDLLKEKRSEAKFEINDSAYS
jgi:hypothetical protein